MFHRGDVIAKIRKQHGWNQAALAKRAGLNKDTVVNAEQNKASVTMDVWHKLASALGTTVDAVNAIVDQANRSPVTSPVTSPAHPPAFTLEAPRDMDTPKTRLLHFVSMLSEEQAAILLPLALQWLAKLIGGADARGPSPRK